MLHRRQALGALLGGPCVLGGLAGTLQSALAQSPASAWTRKRAVLFTLYGGNDNLNTLVPWKDPLYRRLRPRLALDTRRVLPLNQELALHPRLRQTMAMFQAGEVAIVQDVGYPQPNLSHFESAAIWESSRPELGTRAETGWWGEVVMGNRAAFEQAQFDASALAMDRNIGFANGVDVPLLQIDKSVSNALASGGAAARPLQAAAASAGTPAQLAQALAQGAAVRARVAARLRGAPAPAWPPYEDPFAAQTRLTHWLLANGVTAPVLTVAQGGFDTHAEQLKRHDDLMAGFDRGLAALRQRLQSLGLWNDTVVVVHSEFGRRVAENGFGGTDHGTAGPLLLVGGRVQGGLYGRRALLDDLDADGNLKHSTDFRRVYATLVERLWSLPVNPFAAAGFAPLDIGLA